jgi:adenylate cyclase
LQQKGRWEEWTRGIHAEFANRLAEREPVILAYDFFFSEESRIYPESDLAFGDALSLYEGAVTGMYVVMEDGSGRSRTDPAEYYFGEKTFPLTRITGDPNQIPGGNEANIPIPYIAESAYTGSINCPPSRIDNMRREMPLVIRLGDKVFPSFVLQILLRLEEANPDDVEVVLGEAITVPKRTGGEWRIPIDSYGRMAINYRNTARLAVFDYIHVSEQLEIFHKGQAGGKPWPEALPPFTDQIVLIGQAAAGLQDLCPTPYEANDPLFKVQATTLDNILQGDYLTFAPKYGILAGWLLVALMTLLLLRKAPVSLEIIVPFLTVSAYLFLALRLFQTQSLVLPVVLPVGGFLLIHTSVIIDRLLAELKEKRYIKGVFGSYVSPEVVRQIIETGETPKLGGERVDITILFSDIQGFSTFSEQLEPEELVELMVEYLSEMTDIITDHGGTLDKYIGDAIDAMFGAPLPLPDHGYRGVTSALLMQRKQLELQKRWKAANRPELIQGMRTRIGLNTGPAVVGNMGSQRRFNYTMMGDNVNLGARCESAAKSYGVYLMITGATKDAAVATKDDLVYRFLDQIIVKGRTHPVKIYELIEEKSRISPEVNRCLEIYEEGMEFYLSRDWDRAIAAFHHSAECEHFQPGPGIETNPSLVMAKRSAVMKIDPPGDDWDGVFRMLSK